MAEKPVRKVYSLRLDPADAALLKQIRERDGAPVSEQIRRALRLWFEKKGVSKSKKSKK